MLIDGESTPVNLRIIGDVPGASRGRLEMSVGSNVFRPVCHSRSSYYHEAWILCRALGYDGRNAQVRQTQKNARRWALEDISCSGAQSLDDCLGETHSYCYSYTSAIELDCGSGSTTGFDSCGDCGDAMLMGDDCSVSGHTCDFRTGCEP